MTEFYLKLFPKLANNKNLANILPRLQNEKTKSFTTVVLTLIAIIFFSLFAISPTISTIVDLQKQLQDNQFIEKQLTEKISNLISLQQDYAQIQDNIPVIIDTIPESPSIPLLFGQIQAIIEKTGVTIIRIQSFPVEISNNISPVNSYSSFSFVIDASGSYKIVNDLLSSLKNLNRIITIDGIVISKDSSSSSDDIKVNIKAKAYFKKSIIL